MYASLPLQRLVCGPFVAACVRDYRYPFQNLGSLDPIYCVGGVGVSRYLFEHILDVLPYIQAFADFRVGVQGITLLFLVISHSVA